MHIIQEPLDMGVSAEDVIIHLEHASRSAEGGMARLRGHAHSENYVRLHEKLMHASLDAKLAKLKLLVALGLPPSTRLII